MRDFFTRALVGATLSSVAVAQLGTGLLCVDEDLIDIFNSINSLRTTLTASTVYTNLVADIAAYSSANNYWLYDDAEGGQILSGGEASLTDAKTAVDNVAAALPAFTWAEGIALATLENAADYVTLQSALGVPIDNASTSTMVNEHGEWADGLIEIKFEVSFDTELTANDVAQILLINDGDAQKQIQAALLNPLYTRMAVARQINNAGNKYFIDLILAETYTNNADVAWCQVYRDFGENYCIPSATEEAIFIYQNAIRMEPDVWDETYQAIRDAFNPPNQDDTLDCIYDFNGDGTAETRIFKSGYGYVNASLTSAQTKTAILPLKWMPGLYLSAKDHVTDQASVLEVSETGTDGSTPSSRASVYGVGGIYESISLGDYTTQQIVITLIIGDEDSGAARARIFDSTLTHIGVAYGDQSTFGKVTVFDYAKESEYYTNEPWASCTEEEEVVDIVYIGGALGGAALGVATLGALATIMN